MHLLAYNYKGKYEEIKSILKASHRIIVHCPQLIVAYIHAQVCFARRRPPGQEVERSGYEAKALFAGSGEGVSPFATNHEVFKLSNEVFFYSIAL